MGRTLYRYTLQEMLLPFGLGLSLFTFVLLLARLLKLIELVVNRGLPPLTIFQLVGYILPAFLEVTVPMAMLLGILIAFGRLSADNEVVAMRSAGLSLYQLTPPVATFVVAATVTTAVLAMWTRPWANHALRRMLVDLAQTNAMAGLRPQAFNDEFPGVVLYAETIDTTERRLGHVLVSDERDSGQHNTVFAREGRMLPDKATQTLTLQLLDGAIYTVDLDGRGSYETRFASYDITLDLADLLAGSGPEDPQELTLPQLREAIDRRLANGERPTVELIEYHRKFAIPFACVIFGIIGLPLSLTAGRAVRARGFATSIVVIFVYYILLSSGEALADQERIPPVLGLWLANLVLMPVGVVLFVRSARGRPFLHPGARGRRAS